MGRVSCDNNNGKHTGNNRVSSPMGRVSCDVIGYGIGEVANCFVPYGACELRQIALTDLGEINAFRPLWGV